MIRNDERPVGRYDQSGSAYDYEWPAVRFSVGWVYAMLCMTDEEGPVELIGVKREI